MLTLLTLYLILLFNVRLFSTDTSIQFELTVASKRCTIYFDMYIKQLYSKHALIASRENMHISKEA